MNQKYKSTFQTRYNDSRMRIQKYFSAKQNKYNEILSYHQIIIYKKKMFESTRIQYLRHTKLI